MTNNKRIQINIKLNEKRHFLLSLLHIPAFSSSEMVSLSPLPLQSSGSTRSQGPFRCLPPKVKPWKRRSFFPHLFDTRAVQAKQLNLLFCLDPQAVRRHLERHRATVKIATSALGRRNRCLRDSLVLGVSWPQREGPRALERMGMIPFTQSCLLLGRQEEISGRQLLSPVQQHPVWIPAAVPVLRIQSQHSLAVLGGALGHLRIAISEDKCLSFGDGDYNTETF